LTKPLLALLVLPVTLAYAGANAPDPKAVTAEQSLKKQQDSLDRQRASLHQQLSGDAVGATGKAADPTMEPAAYFIDPLPALPQADCERLDKTSVESLIAAAAKKQSLEPALLRAVMKQESGFKPCAVSVRGAQGLMQLMPATADLLHVADPFDPEQNVQAGAAFLKQLLGRYKGDLRLALVAYNAGPLRADQSANTPYPAETQNYLASIFAQLGMSQAPTLPDFEPPPDSAPAATEAESVPAKSADPAPDKEPAKENDKEAPVEKPAKP
jgi:soluble lytic murein transglycosylase-like protein